MNLGPKESPLLGQRCLMGSARSERKRYFLRNFEGFFRIVILYHTRFLSSWITKAGPIHVRTIRYLTISHCAISLSAYIHSASLTRSNLNLRLTMGDIHLHDELLNNDARVVVQTSYGPVTGGRATNGSAVFLGMHSSREFADSLVVNLEITTVICGN